MAPFDGKHFAQSANAASRQVPSLRNCRRSPARFLKCRQKQKMILTLNETALAMG
jgi:hypothetical protein